MKLARKQFLSGGAAIHSKPSLVKPVNIEVSYEGEIVKLRIGNAILDFHYEDALKISQWIRLRAKEAKAACGDQSRHWSAIASLTGTPAEDK